VYIYIYNYICNDIWFPVLSIKLMDYIYISVLLTSMYILLSDITYQYVYIYISIWLYSIYTDMRYIWKPRDMTTPSLHCPGAAAQWSLHLWRVVGVLRWGPSQRGLDVEINGPAGSLGWKSWNHRIGWWENLQETSIFDGKNHGFQLRFSLKPIYWWKEFEAQNMSCSSVNIGNVHGF